jgi:hypothetical protein
LNIVLKQFKQKLNKKLMNHVAQNLVENQDGRSNRSMQRRAARHHAENLETNSGEDSGQSRPAAWRR